MFDYIGSVFVCIASMFDSIAPMFDYIVSMFDCIAQDSPSRVLAFVENWTYTLDHLSNIRTLDAHPDARNSGSLAVVF
jgi:hypothetical protein